MSPRRAAQNRGAGMYQKALQGSSPKEYIRAEDNSVRIHKEREEMILPMLINQKLPVLKSTMQVKTTDRRRKTVNKTSMHTQKESSSQLNDKLLGMNSTGQSPEGFRPD